MDGVTDRRYDKPGVCGGNPVAGLALRVRRPMDSGRFGRMNEVDGRAVAVGIAVGTILGFLVYSATQNTIWIYLGAGIGIILALGLGQFTNSNGDDTHRDDSNGGDTNGDNSS